MLIYHFLGHNMNVKSLKPTPIKLTDTNTYYAAPSMPSQFYSLDAVSTARSCAGFPFLYSKYVQCSFLQCLVSQKQSNGIERPSDPQQQCQQQNNSDFCVMLDRLPLQVSTIAICTQIVLYYQVEHFAHHRRTKECQIRDKIDQ